MFESLITIAGSESGNGFTAAICRGGEIAEWVSEFDPRDLASRLPQAAICVIDGIDVSRFSSMETIETGRHIWVDLHEWARVVLPTLGHYDLPYICEHLGLKGNIDDNPQSQCQALLDAFSKLMQIALTLPSPTLFEIEGILKGAQSRSIRKVFEKVQALQFSSTTEGQPQSIIDQIRVEAAPRPRAEDGVSGEFEPIDPEDTESLLGPTGPFAAEVTNYEWREGQIRMARAVAEAFNSEHHLMVEAGTGTGKSLAYLVPAVQWALKNKTPIVVSTNTKNLQSQLFERDLPLIERVLGSDLKVALIKGRGNYLCLRKLLYLLDHAGFELRPDERVTVAGVLVWLTQTDTGDLTDLGILTTPAGRGVVSRLVSTADECGGRSCRNYRKCFLRRARAKSMAADIVVANHSLVFADMGAKSQAIPPHAFLVMDEAHNIEDAATRHFAVEISSSRIQFPLRRLGRLNEKGGGKGLLAALDHQISSGALTGDVRQQEHLTRLSRSVSRCCRELDGETAPFFEALAGLLQGDNSESRRLSKDDQGSPLWSGLEDAERILKASFSNLNHALESLVTALQDLDAEGLGFQTEFIQDLEAQRVLLQEIGEEIAFVLSMDSPDYVYWVERDMRGGGRRACGWAAPIEVGGRLSDELYQSKSSIIFSSATLSVRGTFKFLQRRLGLDQIDHERIVELDVGTPFDYSRQSLMMVPMFLPEPNDVNGDYAADLGDLLAALFRCTRGRAMALFTSYSMLRKTTQCVRDDLLDSDINVLAQGEATSREALIGRFRDEVASVLMGTHSFWEGVDVAGESLSCVVLARLPFAVFTDPMVEARCERIDAAGGSSFMEYSLPSAVIRFRQGFGRLIRHRQDRGIVIVADRRISTKRYGHWFRSSVPVQTVKMHDAEGMLDAVEQFLAEG